VKKRVIPLLLVKEGRLVKGVKFSNFRSVGDPISAAKVYSSQLADELVIVSIDQKPGCLQEDFLEVLREIRSKCSMPLTVGGGVRGIKGAKLLFSHGADRLLVNSGAFHIPNLLPELASSFGSQAIICGVDYRDAGNQQLVVTSQGRNNTEVPLVERIVSATQDGAGELLVQNVNREGAMQGLDIGILPSIRAVSNCPVILSGGVGNFEHISEAFEAGADGVACGSVFNFGDNSPIRAEHYLRSSGLQLKRS